jgi:hypothetical protein
MRQRTIDRSRFSGRIVLVFAGHVGVLLPQS